MDFLAFALEMEDKIIQNYKKLAEQCLPHEGIRRILMMLVDDHEKHVSTLNKMKDKPELEVEDSPTFKEAAQLFTKMREEKQTFSCDMDQLQLYREARALLQKKHDLYLEMSKKFNSDAALPMLNILITEEKRQMKVLDNIIEMVSRPQYWLDNAEFFHLDEY